MLTFEYKGIVIKAQLLEFGDDISYELLYEDMTPIKAMNKPVRISFSASRPKDDVEILLRRDKEIFLSNGEEPVPSGSPEEEYDKEIREAEEKETYHRGVIQDTIEDLFEKHVIKSAT